MLGLPPGHQNFPRPQKPNAGGHPLDRAATGIQAWASGQHHQAGTEAHQHMHPQPVRVHHCPVVSPVQADR